LRRFEKTVNEFGVEIKPVRVLLHETEFSRWPQSGVLSLQKTLRNATGSQINLAWTDNSTNEVNFLIERSIDGTNFTLIGAVTFAVANFADQTISPGVTYFYRVRARNPGGNSAYSQIASAPLAFDAVHQSGNNFVFDGFGGAASNTYYVLTSTDLNLILPRWQRATTNQFGSIGDFSVTNVVSPETPQLFYRLQLR
jgi:hypothetical protein